MSTPSFPPSIPDDEYPTVEGFRLPVDEGYYKLIGQATYAFTYLEWSVVCIGDKIAPGFLNEAAPKTAGSIGLLLESKVKTFAGDAALTAEIADLAGKFRALAKRRNKLLHAHPATLHGKQRLHYWSPEQDPLTGSNVFDWEPGDVVAFTNDTQDLALLASRLLYDPRMPGTAPRIVP
jgi:hypothetical protein